MIGIGIDYNKTKSKKLLKHKYMCAHQSERVREYIYIGRRWRKRSWEKFVVSLLLISL